MKSRKINVLQILNSLEVGGAERVAINILKHLNKDYFKSFLCTIDGLGLFASELTNEEIEILNLDKGDGFKPWISLRLAHFLRKRKIDIVTSHNLSPLLYGKMATRVSGTKHFIHVDHARDFPGKKRIIGSERQLTNSVCKIIAVTEELKENLIRFEKISCEKIQVILNGIDGGKYSIEIDKNKKREELGIPSGKFIIGTGVRLAEQKGIIYLIEAVKKISLLRNEFLVVIVGDGPEKEKLIKTVEEKKLKDVVRFYGFRLDLPEILQLIDIYVLPSIWEGLPLSLLEAMAAGKAIVATDVGDNRKVIEHKKNGYLIPPKSAKDIVKALVFLMDNPKHRESLGKEACTTFKNNYSLNTMIDEYQRIYSTCIHNS